MILFLRYGLFIIFGIWDIELKACILTEISKIFKQMHVLQKQKQICIVSACVLHSIKCCYILNCNTELFLNKQKV